jgi:Mg-chelatase subunit ChlI
VLSCIENIARLARIYAEENGRETLKLADIKQAISDCLPSRPRPEQTPQESEAVFPDDTAKKEVQPPIFNDRQRHKSGSLLRLNKPASGKNNRIENPALVLAD